ncbi:MAG: restriction endonuclease subunit S, partial [Bacteroidetes bacterium]|nr:restriction endonuclease subunit S [Bacteroidota bacterium]
SMDLVKPEPNENIDPSYLYSMFSYSIFGDEVKEYANGANVLHLLPARIKEFKFPLPSKCIREKFTKLITTTFSLIDNLSKKTQNLHQTRDLLLPKLISGKVDVSELDIDIGET